MEKGSDIPKSFKPGSVRAEDLLIQEISKPIAERDKELIEALNDALRSQIELTYDLKHKVGKILDIELPGLRPVAIVDSKGKVQGYAAADIKKS